MVKWLLVVVVALVLFSGLSRCCAARHRTAARDFEFRAFGRDWSIPITSTVLLSLLAALLARLL